LPEKGDLPRRRLVLKEWKGRERPAEKKKGKWGSRRTSILLSIRVKGPERKGRGTRGIGEPARKKRKVERELRQPFFFDLFLDAAKKGEKKNQVTGQEEEKGGRKTPFRPFILHSAERGGKRKREGLGKEKRSGSSTSLSLFSGRSAQEEKERKV